jgi:hypothetical protein
MLFCLLLALFQTPVPFPRPGDVPRPSAPAPAPLVTTPRPASQQNQQEPTEQTLGMPIYPGAQFVASYDAGRGQR